MKAVAWSGIGQRIDFTKKTVGYQWDITADLMGFIADLMDFYSDSMGYEWDINGTPGLVNVNQKTNWKDPACYFHGKSHYFNGHGFYVANCSSLPEAMSIGMFH